MPSRVRRLPLLLALLGMVAGCTHHPSATGPASALQGPARQASSRSATGAITRLTPPGTAFTRLQPASPFAPRLVVTTQVAHGDLFPHAFGDTGPRYLPVKRLYRGQHAYLLPLAANYGVTADRRTDLTYELAIRKPDGSHDGDTFSAVLWQGSVGGPGLVLYPATTVAFHAEPQDPAGDYQVTVRVTDHLAGETSELTHAFTLADYASPALPADFDASLWFNSYYQQPAPEFALPALFPLFSRLPADQRAAALPSLLGFYDQILVDNPWLLPAFAARLATADPDAAYPLSLVLGHHLRAATEPPAGIDFATWSRLEDFRTHTWAADSDAPLAQAAQLDALWGRFFASGLYAPVGRILDALAHHADLGATDRWQTLQTAAGQPIDLSPETLASPDLTDAPGAPPAEVRRDVLLRNALWSLRRNANQHPLVRSYLDWTLQAGGLPPPQKSLLDRILATEPAAATPRAALR